MLADLTPDMLHRFTMRLAERPPFPIDRFPDADAWLEYRHNLRQRVQEVLGFHLYQSCELAARTTGVLERDDYCIEKVLFYSQPDVPVTANLYLPNALAAPAPAILHPHGHWGFGKAAEPVQKRCIWLARHGFVSLAPDGWGFGERAATGHRYEQALALTGASIAGLETWDNQRALDYLCTRPEVDPSRLGVTGCSGGGLQTTLLVATDDRLAAAAAVCFPVTWHSLFSTDVSHCLCNFIPNIYRYADVPELLATFAPNPLLHVTARRDRSFPPGGARECFARASAYWQLLGCAENARYLEVDDEHGYSQPMREAMYGWFLHHLAGVGDGGAVDEGEITPEPEASRRLWCLPDGLPEGTTTASALNRRFALAITRPQMSSEVLRRVIREGILGGFPAAPAPVVTAGEEGRVVTDGAATRIVYLSEPGIAVPALLLEPGAGGHVGSAALYLSPSHKEQALTDPVVTELMRRGWTVLAPDLRGRGETHWPADESRGSDEYTSFSRLQLLGRPLFACRVWDAMQSLKLLRSRPGVSQGHVAVVSDGVAGLEALYLAALDEEVAAVAIWGALVSYVPDEPGVFSTEIPFSTFLPGILALADLPQVAALVAPRPLLLAGGVNSLNRPALGAQDRYRTTKEVYESLGAGERFELYQADQNARDDLLAGWLVRWLPAGRA